jgi:hypothetical protein
VIFEDRLKFNNPLININILLFSGFLEPDMDFFRNTIVGVVKQHKLYAGLAKA